MTRAVILVPRRSDDGGMRDAVWSWCRARWEAAHPELTIYEGYHVDGLFNRSAALNRAAKLADRDGKWDQAVVVDADVFIAPAQVRAALALARETGHVTWAFRRWRGLSEAATKRLVQPDLGYEHEIFGPGGVLAWDGGASARREAMRDALAVKGVDAQLDALERSLTTVRLDMLDTIVEKTNPLSWSCCFVVPRKAWDKLGGFDERFEGWGFEDMAFQSAVGGLVGWEGIEGDVFHLWHPRTAGLGAAAYTRTSEDRESINNARLGRRYMVALRRDYGLNDRTRDHKTMPDEERERDVATLKKDDARYKVPAVAAGLPEWDDYWPTLEELVADAKEYRKTGHNKPRASKISLIVRSGGTAANWPARREYLRATLASLDEHVKPGRSQIVRRVIFSDWPKGITPELQQIANEHGAYVVGEGNLGYTSSMQKLWAYLASRKDAFDYVFLAEDDFTYDRDIDLDEFAQVLTENPHLTQVALLRDAFYPSEREKGGILGWAPDTFTARRMNGYGWLEHRNFWTANPCLFRRSLTNTRWPSGQSSERLFADALFKDAGKRSAFWGDGAPWIRHVGTVRAGVDY